MRSKRKILCINCQALTDWIKIGPRYQCEGCGTSRSLNFIENMDRRIYTRFINYFHYALPKKTKGEIEKWWMAEQI